MKKVAVLGASGMAGHVIATYLREQGYGVDTVGSTKKFDDDTTLLDLTSQKDLSLFLRNNTYDVIINCVAALVADSESDRPRAVQLNALLPASLEKQFAGTTTKIVHLSTDGVFSGKKALYEESDDRDGESFYGRSKALGELENDKDVTIRMSIIGPSMHQEAGGMFHWFVTQKEKEIFGYTNAYWNGITTLELARFIEMCIEKNIHNIVHLAPTQGILKIDLLKLFQRTFDRNDVTIKPSEGSSLNTQLQSTRTDITWNIPEYTQMLIELKQWIKDHPKLYPHYGIA